ncbi:hypothetical protein BN871_HF_00080 [Paenibacillus sp. P22]|nr:hypothetical protein BN871_HF_00080 [Paenibacillus sp. P22]
MMADSDLQVVRRKHMVVVAPIGEAGVDRSACPACQIERMQQAAAVVDQPFAVGRPVRRFDELLEFGQHGTLARPDIQRLEDADDAAVFLQARSLPSSSFHGFAPPLCKVDGSDRHFLAFVIDEMELRVQFRLALDQVQNARRAAARIRRSALAAHIRPHPARMHAEHLHAARAQQAAQLLGKHVQRRLRNAVRVVAGISMGQAARLGGNVDDGSPRLEQQRQQMLHDAHRPVQVDVEGMLDILHVELLDTRVASLQHRCVVDDGAELHALPLERGGQLRDSIFVSHVETHACQLAWKGRLKRLHRLALVLRLAHACEDVMAALQSFGSELQAESPPGSRNENVHVRVPSLDRAGSCPSYWRIQVQSRRAKYRLSIVRFGCGQVHAALLLVVLQQLHEHLQLRNRIDVGVPASGILALLLQREALALQQHDLLLHPFNDKSDMMGAFPMLIEVVPPCAGMLVRLDQLQLQRAHVDERQLGAGGAGRSHEFGLRGVGRIGQHRLRLRNAEEIRVSLADLVDIVDENSNLRNDVVSKQSCHREQLPFQFGSCCLSCESPCRCLAVKSSGKNPG